MDGFWKTFFGRSSKPKDLSLVDYAENYLSVFAAATNQEQSLHAEHLYEVANDAAREVGEHDFYELIQSSNTEALITAAVYTRTKFEKITLQNKDYWLSAYALVHLMLLNNLKSMDSPRAKEIATNAAHLCSAEYARRQKSLR